MGNIKGGNYYIDLTSCGVLSEGTEINFSRLEKNLKEQIFEIFENGYELKGKQIKFIVNTNLFNSDIYTTIVIDAYMVVNSSIISATISPTSTASAKHFYRIEIDYAANEAIIVKKYLYN